MAERFIRLIRRLFPKHRPITITGIMLSADPDDDDDHVYVDAEINGEWVTVIRETYCEGGIISHIVEPLGMRIAAEAQDARRQTAVKNDDS